MENSSPLRIVITGATGYIGSLLAHDLASRGYPLRLVSRSPWPAGGRKFQGDVALVSADLSRAGAWESLIDGADAVIHLSYRTDLRAAERDPREDADMNIGPVRRLIDAITAADRRAVPVVFASTVTICGPAPSGPVDETHRDNPISVYDRHKLTCEELLRDATNRGVVSACALRLANVYGYGPASVNSNRGILNFMMRFALKGEPLTLYGDGEYIRDYVHVRDVVSAFRLAIECPEARTGDAYIISGETGHSLKEIFSLISREAGALTGIQPPVVHVPEPADLHPIERRNFTGNSSLFRERTGWVQERPLEDNLRSDLSCFHSDMHCLNAREASQ